MNADDYKTKLARAETLTALDPAANSPEGQELIALAEEIEAYEREHFPFEGLEVMKMTVTKLDIAMLRGGLPAKCDFCSQDMPPEQLEPEEAGCWVCWHCLLKWAQEDGNAREEMFWKRCIKEVECRHTP